MKQAGARIHVPLFFLFLSVYTFIRPCFLKGAFSPCLYPSSTRIACKSRAVSSGVPMAKRRAGRERFNAAV